MRIVKFSKPPKTPPKWPLAGPLDVLNAPTGGMYLKGGAGSGNFGHSGRPGKVGGSAPDGGSIATKLSADDPYIADLQAYLIARNNDSKKRSFSMGGNEENATMHLGFRIFHGSDDVQREMALAKHVEERTDRETMLYVLGSQEAWTGSPKSAKSEWLAVKAIHGAEIPEGVLGDRYDFSPNELTEKQIEGFKARQEFVQAVFRETYGEEVEMYRGVQGPYAGKIKKEMNKRMAEAGFHGGVYTEASRDMSLRVNGLTSFSRFKSSAITFARPYKRGGGIRGAILRKIVRASDVWLMPRDVGVVSPIRFMEDNGEVVTFNPSGSSDVYVEDWGD